MSNSNSSAAPISDAIAHAVSRLVDDAQSATREPSHFQLGEQLARAGLTDGDPKSQGQAVGKAKRVRAALNWALDNCPEAGGIFVGNLVALVRGCGGFREESPNYVGREVIIDLTEIFKSEGYHLLPNGEICTSLLDNLEGIELSDALQAYVSSPLK